MSVPATPETTELHAPAPKVFGNERVTQTRDVNDINRIFMLAAEVAEGDVRDVTGLSVAEIVAIAQVCAMSALVVHASARLFTRSDDIAEGKERRLVLYLKELAKATTPFMGGGT